MPAILGWIVSGVISGVLWLFKNRVGQIIMAVLAWAGVSLATYSLGVQPFIDHLTDLAQGGMGGGEYAAVALQWMGLLNFDKAMTMIISAVAAKHAVNAGRVFFRRAATGA
jgi:hypothetical protein